MSTKVVRIALTTKKKWSLKSQLIKWRMGKKYSHACIIQKDETLDLYDVYQASHGQVHEIDLDIFKEENELVKVFYLEMSIERFNKGHIWLKKQRGKRYSVWGMIASTVPFLRKIGLGADGDKEFICSEYAFRYLEEIYMDVKSDKSEDYITPGELEYILERAEYVQARVRKVSNAT